MLGGFRIKQRVEGAAMLEPGLQNPAFSSQNSSRVILAGFEAYQSRFTEITARAKSRFERREWRANQQDAVERLDLYKEIVTQTVEALIAELEDRCKDPALWTEMKSGYAQLAKDRHDLELAETFFNSITRRIFSTVGVDPQIEFVEFNLTFPRESPDPSLIASYPVPDDYRPDIDPEGAAQVLGRLIQSILEGQQFSVAFADLKRDAIRVAREIFTHLRARSGSASFERIEMLRPAFYRSNGAYLIGRIHLSTQAALPLDPQDLLGPGELPAGTLAALRQYYLPLILCLQHPPGGICVDAVLLDEDEASIVFSYARSYFHVTARQPSRLVGFLKTIIPLKRVAELYISIGYNKHGKTELYRDLLHHLQHSTDSFEIARGERGMVMLVFTLPSYDMVFKVIKDRPEPPKTTTHQEVRDRYDLVFRHDRAGRLVDAQEFEHLSFERRRFSETLVAELLAKAPGMVTVSQDCVNVKHLYTERRMTPLNLYVREAAPAQARLAVLDYGQAIKDLAATNIFPGDILLKNFGVTRHGRVVFYDYDELCQVTDCQFRKIPQPASHFDEYAEEPFFYVGPMDIFPEEFLTFLGLKDPLRGHFIAAHGDLFGIDFWREMQRQHVAGEVIDIPPYPAFRRLDMRQSAS